MPATIRRQPQIETFRLVVDYDTHILDQRKGLRQRYLHPPLDQQCDQWESEIIYMRENFPAKGLGTADIRIQLLRFNHWFERMAEVRDILSCRNLRSANIEELVAFRYQFSEAIKHQETIVCPGIINITPVSSCHGGNKEPHLLSLGRTGNHYFLNAFPNINGGCPDTWGILAAPQSDD